MATRRCNVLRYGYTSHVMRDLVTKYCVKGNANSFRTVSKIGLYLHIIFSCKSGDKSLDKLNFETLNGVLGRLMTQKGYCILLLDSRPSILIYL